MKTLPRTSTSPRKRAADGGKPAAATIPAPKLAVCGTGRRLTREQLMAEDAAFLARMKGGARARKGAVELVREGR